MTKYCVIKLYSVKKVIFKIANTIKFFLFKIKELRLLIVIYRKASYMNKSKV